MIVSVPVSKPDVVVWRGNSAGGDGVRSGQAEETSFSCQLQCAGQRQQGVTVDQTVYRGGKGRVQGDELLGFVVRRDRDAGLSDNKRTIGKCDVVVRRRRSIDGHYISADAASQRWLR